MYTNNPFQPDGFENHHVLPDAIHKAVSKSVHEFFYNIIEEYDGYKLISMLDSEYVVVDPHSRSATPGNPTLRKFDNIKDAKNLFDLLADIK